MPSRTRRRKSRKRKPSLRKKSSRKRSRRCVSHPRANALSSDEDYVLESEAEENSSDFDGSVASSSDEEEEDALEEEEQEEEGEEESKAISVNARNEAQSSARSVQRRTSRPRRRPRKPSSSDEEFNVDIERDSNDAESVGEGQLNPRSTRIRLDCIRNSVNDADFDVDVERNGVQEHASRPARVHHRRRKQDSSDEDFETTIEKDLDNGGRANEGAGATRPITRAMEAGHGSDSCAEGLVSEFVQLEEDVLPIVNLKRGEPSLSISSSSARGAGTIDKDTAANKRKGKEKVLEGEESLFAAEVAVAMGTEDGATAAVVCGICLSETAIVERGKLDCCNHFFCFVCIMEWAKVESRCPMCKQRFATVAKAGSGVSKRTRTIRIPMRDQVYIPPEDDLPFEDPYVDVVCMECLGTGDEGLLLLCDRCDSAAHTFCVGLGRSVPRGDWYCRDCQALIGENSASENEVENFILASDSEEEDEDFLIRSIVASDSQPRRQRRVQRAAVLTNGPPSQPRRRLGAGGRRRLWRHLLSRRGSSRRVATAPQLSQSARAFLSSITPELNPVSRVSEASQSGSARTVPQQRRLQERIVAMRNNWGRIQNGDVQFDAIRTQAAGSVQPTVLPSGIAAPTSATASALNNRVDAKSAETSTRDGKDLERAWQMLGQAQKFSAGTSSNGVHQQRPVLSHHVPMPSSLLRSPQPTASTITRATSSLPCVNKNTDRPTHVVSPQRSESDDAGIKREPKEHHEALSGRGKVLTAGTLVLTDKIGEEKKQEYPCSSRATSPIDVQMDSCRTSQLAGGQTAADSAMSGSDNREKMAITQGPKPQAVESGRHYKVEARRHNKVEAGRHNTGRTHNLTGNAMDKEGVSHAKESGVPKSTFSPPHDGLKVHLTELVKKQTWPVYIAERLDKEQFKRIARAAVHSLLAHCDPSNKSVSLSCPHLEDQGKNPIVNCCTNCLDQHVENAVRTAKDKIVPN